MKKKLLKRIGLTLLLSPAVFFLITALSYHNSLAACGHVAKGYPMRYYLMVGGELAPHPPVGHISYSALAVDLLFALFVSIIAYEIIRRGYNMLAWAFS